MKVSNSPGREWRDREGVGGALIEKCKYNKQAKTIKYVYKANRLIRIQLQLAAYHIWYLIRN